MLKRKLILGLLFLGILLGILPISVVKAKGDLCLVYFTGIGCPHCARTDPVILDKALNQHPNLVIIEYEIYQTSGNAPLLIQYADSYHLPSSQRGIPTLYISKNPEGIIVGDTPILENFEKKLSLASDKCLLADGSAFLLSRLNLEELPGYPKLWHQNRVLIKKKAREWIFAWNGKSVPEKNSIKGNSPDILLKLLKVKDPTSILSSVSYESLSPNFKVPLSGRERTFQWAVKLKTTTPPVSTTSPSSTSPLPSSQKLTFAKVVSLASVDAINPCALAVLLLMLTAIMAGSLRKKRDVLLGGLSFIIAVFVIYFVYGLIIIKFFQLIQVLAPVKIWLYRTLGGLAILFGLLNLKDFFFYKPGGIATEMPLSFRPRAKKLIAKATSPIGAFLVGVFVTLFLLPCTIGPYFIAGGLLSSMAILKTIPWLLLYNLVFVLPMLAIVFLVWVGLSRVKDISQWKDKNIRKIHLIEGLIMLLLGIIIVLGRF